MSPERHIRWLAQLQRVQDLLSQFHRLSLVVLDENCAELTVPSGLPTECGSADPSHTSTCWQMRREAIARVRVSRQPEALLCPKGRACFVSPLGIAQDDYETPCQYYLAGSGPPQAIAAVKLVQEVFRLVRPATAPAQAASPAAAERPSQPAASSPTPLTPREQEILALLSAGLSNREIANRLYISEATVKTHVTHLLQKLGLRNRTEAALYAMRDQT